MCVEGAVLGCRPDSSPYGLVSVDDIRGDGEGATAIGAVVVEAKGGVEACGSHNHFG